MNPDRWTPEIKARESSKLKTTLFDSLYPKTTDWVKREAVPAVVKWAEEKNPPAGAIPATKTVPMRDFAGGKMVYSSKQEPAIRSSWSDPDVAERGTLRDDRSGGALMRALSLFSGQMPMTEVGSDGKLRSTAKHIAEVSDNGKDMKRATQEAFAPVFSAVDVMNDAHTRLANARKWSADSPFTAKDDAVYEYTTPQGNVYKLPYDRVAYYDLGEGGGKVRSSAEIEDKNNYFTEDGRYYVIARDGTRLPAAAVQGDLLKRFSHYGFPDGTIEMDKSGRPSEFMSEAPKEQANVNWLKGPSEPRAVWMDTAGRSALTDNPLFKPGQPDEWYHSGQAKSTWKEGIYQLADGILGSLPYMVPNYNLAAGAARVIPYAMGYNGQSYAPVDRGFAQLGKLGEGTYSADILTNAQRVGGGASQIADAVAERLGGGAVGGMTKFVLPGALRAAIGTNPIGHLLLDAIGEGVEELLPVIPDQMSRDSLKNLGRESSYNNETGEIEYKGNRGAMTFREAVDAFANGAQMGLGMSGAPAALNALSNARIYGRSGPPPAPSIAPRASEQRGSQQQKAAAVANPWFVSE